MDILLKAVAGALVAVVLALSLSKQGKDVSILLVLAVCCMVFAAAGEYLSPVLDFFQKLEDVGKLDRQMLRILLKAVGIGILSEITGLICADAGYGALGKALQILTSAVVLWLALPLFTQLIDLAQEILEAV